MAYRSAIPSGRMKKASYVTGGRSPLPHTPGIYRHVNKKTGKVDYVGQTNDLRRRQQEHRAAGTLNLRQQRIEYKEAKLSASRDDLCNTERKHIARHQPTGNTYRGGNGRR